MARKRVEAALDSLAGRAGVSGNVSRKVRVRVDSRSLPRRAAAVGAPYTRADRDFLRDLELALGGRPIKRVAVLVDERSNLLPTWMAARWPQARIVCLVSSPTLRPTMPGRRAVVEVATTAAVRHAVLSAYGRFDAVVDWITQEPEAQTALFEETFLHLRRGGVYLTTSTRPSGDGSRPHLGERLDRLTATEVSAPPAADLGLAAAIVDVQQRGHSVLVECGGGALPKLRYHEMDRVLALRGSVGRVLSTVPPQEFGSRASVTMNRANPGAPFAPVIKAPGLALREYADVTCAPYQVLIAGQMLIPDTYRHYLNRTLNHGHVTDLGVRFGRPRKKPKRPQELSGTFFYLGSEVPQHFGHVMTEQLSRLWAWADVKRRYPEAKALLDVRPRHDGLRPWEIEIFAAAGVDPDDLLPVTGAVRVERLLAAAPMFVNTQYAHPQISDVWTRTATALIERAPERAYPERVFVSRRPDRRNRHCSNADVVEDFFRSRGFEIIYPEDHGVAEQAMIFRRLRVVAGFAGSGLFSMLFSGEPKTVIVLWPETYTSRNEYLISSVLGHRLHVFWCPNERSHPVGGWDFDAYQSTFSFDVDRDAARLDETISRA